MYEVSVASFRPAIEPALFTTTTWVCELGGAVIDCTNCTIVGIKAARNTMTRRIMLVMIKLRWCAVSAQVRCSPQERKGENKTFRTTDLLSGETPRGK